MKGKVIKILMLYLSAGTALERPSTGKQYRSDYVYDKRNDIFYKQHLYSKDFEAAKEACMEEGAELVVPLSWHDLIQYEDMFRKHPEFNQGAWMGDEPVKPQPSTEVNDREEYDDVENKSEETISVQLPIQNEHQAVMRNLKVVRVRKEKMLPFICKVKAEDAPYDSLCDVYGNDYHYSETIGSCYKISKFALNWYDALIECQNEGSHLLVLNSIDEKNVVTDLIKRFPSKADSLEEYFVGFRTIETWNYYGRRIFTTIFGQTLEEAGYNIWSQGEPNNKNGIESCGSMYRWAGTFNDLNCFYDHAFVCEKEVVTKKIDIEKEQSEAQTGQSEARTEQSEAQTTQEEAQTVQSETQTEQSESHTEKSDADTHESEAQMTKTEAQTKQNDTWTQQNEAKSDQTKAQKEQSDAQTEQSETQMERSDANKQQKEAQMTKTEAQTDQSDAQTRQSETMSKQSEAQMEQSDTQTEQNETQMEQSDADTQQSEAQTTKSEGQMEQNKVRVEQNEVQMEQSEVQSKQTEAETEV